MKIIPHRPPHPQSFNGDYAELEIAFYTRRDNAERTLLELLYAVNGDIRAGVRIAQAEGIATDTFRHFEHRLLWEIACWAGDTDAAHRMAMLAQKRGEITVIHIPDLLNAWFWSDTSIGPAARRLLEFDAVEHEARLCAARYRALLAGDVKPHRSPMAEARAA